TRGEQKQRGRRIARPRRVDRHESRVSRENGQKGLGGGLRFPVGSRVIIRNRTVDMISCIHCDGQARRRVLPRPADVDASCGPW
ncbi:unnamed protein product, partial [Musa textilis]